MKGTIKWNLENKLFIIPLLPLVLLAQLYILLLNKLSKSVDLTIDIGNKKEPNEPK